MNKSKMIAHLNALGQQLDNLPSEIVETIADTGKVPTDYTAEEALKRLAIEVRFNRLQDKLYR